MKTSFRLQARRQLTRSEAWGCFTANLALPGSGSLVAGRAIGYTQMVFALVGVGVTMVCGVQFLLWFLHNWDKMTAQTEDPVAQLENLWTMIKWPLLGIVIFLVALCWALLTSLAILGAAPKERRLPPRL